MEKKHLDDLRNSTLTDTTINKYRIRSVTREETTALLGIDVSCGGYLIPYPESHFFKIKLDKKRGGCKYLSPKQMTPDMFITFLARGRISSPYYFVEGEKKAMAMEQIGYAAVSVPGVWGWKSRGHISEALAGMDLKDRLCLVCFDADKHRNQHVLKAEYQFASVLNELGAAVKIVNLDAALGKGVDDQIKRFQANGNLDDLKKQYLEQAELYDDYIKRTAENRVDKARQIAKCNLTDLGNAERLVARYKEYIRYCHPWQKWLVWDGRHWELDVTAKVYRYGIDCIRHIYAEAGAEDEKGQRKSIGDHAVKSESEARIRAMLSLAEKLEGIPIRPEELDRDRMLLNVVNGTIDLKACELRSYARDDLITKLAPVKYNKDAVCPKWLDYLNKIMLGNKGLIQFLQRVAGYCLTGMVSEQKLFFLFGSGANGKTTLLRVLQGILGDYAIKAASEILIAKPFDGHTTSITDLRGARLAITVEVQEGKYLAEAMVKELTGGDSITARRMREDNMTFEPTHKIILAANHKPIVHETTIAIWRRIDLIPFNYMFQEAERIKDYHEILLNEEKEGILSWALEGCREWQQVGLAEPPEVIAATREYRNEMDILGEFIEECCAIGQNEEVLNKNLRKTYVQWCEDNGEKAVSEKAFSQRLQEKGFIRKDKIQIGSDRGRGWQGLKLRNK